MKTVLITGLDGSGKSTILDELSKVKKENDFEFVYLPTIDINSLQEDLMLKKTSQFVNYINQLADQLKVPSLKAVAIFSSMLLFKKINGLKAKPSISTMFCERHPLIDTLVYAQFYAEKTGSGLVDKNLLSKIDLNHKQELEYLVQLIPKSFINKSEASIKGFAGFIYNWFFIDKKLTINDLIELFEVKLPDKIYYLKADAEVLFQRIFNRKIREAHETVDILNKLGQGYDRLFIDINKSHPNLVEIIDAGCISSLNEFRIQLFHNYCKSAL